MFKGDGRQRKKKKIQEKYILKIIKRLYPDYFFKIKFLSMYNYHYQLCFCYFIYQGMHTGRLPRLLFKNSCLCISLSALSLLFYIPRYAYMYHTGTCVHVHMIYILLHWYSTTVVPVHVGQHLQLRQNLQQKKDFHLNIYSGCGGLVSAIIWELCCWLAE